MLTLFQRFKTRSRETLRLISNSCLLATAVQPRFTSDLNFRIITLKENADGCMQIMTLFRLMTSVSARR